MLFGFRIAVIALAGALVMATPQHAPPLCHARSDLVDKCFSVHGALRYWNGGIPVRIWRIGTTRVLGVRGLDEVGLPNDSGACPLPSGLRDTLQAVCVDAATHIRAKPYRF